MNAHPPASRPTLVFAGTILGVLATFRELDVLIGRLAQRPVIAFDEVGRWWQLASSRVPWSAAAIGVALLVVAAVVDVRWLGGIGSRRIASLFEGWSALEDGPALRWFVVGVTGVAAWALSCYARNLYFDTLHVPDRLLVVALWIAIAWRPVFVLPFALVAVTTLSTCDR